MFTLQSRHHVDTTNFLQKEKDKGISRWVRNLCVLSLAVVAIFEITINHLLELYFFRWLIMNVDCNAAV